MARYGKDERDDFAHNAKDATNTNGTDQYVPLVTNRPNTGIVKSKCPREKIKKNGYK